MAVCSKTQDQGQSLIEVIVAVGVLSLLLLSVLTLVALSVKNSRVAKDQARAVELSQEGIELIRTFRDYSWTGLKVRATGTNYDLPENWTVIDDLVNGCPAAVNVASFYKRCVSLSQSSAETVDVAVTVSWTEGNQEREINQTTSLSLWER